MTNTTDNPKISIIIPVYNTEKYLSECLESVINQTYKNLEIICIDDGSTDQSLEILKKYTAKDGRIIVKTQENKKVAAARNNGFKSASGKYVYFLDSDDYLYRNNSIEIICNKLEENNADVAVWGILELIDGKFVESHTIHKIRSYIKNPKNFNLISLNTSTTYKMFKKEFLDIHNITFPTKITHSEDTIFSLECHFNNPKYVHVYRKHFTSATGGKINVNKNIFNGIKFLEDKKIYQQQTMQTKLQVIENWLYCIKHYYFSGKQNNISDLKNIIHYFEKKYGKNSLQKLRIYNELASFLSEKTQFIPHQDCTHFIINCFGVKIKIRKKEVKCNEC